LEGLYAAFRIPPIDFIPLETRQRAIRPRRRYRAFGTTTGTINIGATSGTANIGAIGAP